MQSYETLIMRLDLAMFAAVLVGTQKGYALDFLDERVKP